MQKKSSNNDIHAFVISWNGMHDRASYIADQVFSETESTTVIYSNESDLDETGVGNWIKVQNELYFGPKFKVCLDNYTNGIFLLIHADADCSEWKELIRQCKKINEINNMGVWAPNTYHTGWETSKVQIALDKKNNMSFVAQTDGIVFSMNQAIVERMKKLNYQDNNLGWGIDWAAICHAYCTNQLVVRDHNLFVAHQEGSGYKKDEAVAQMNVFLEQLSTQEKLMYGLLSKFIYTAAKN